MKLVFHISEDGFEIDLINTTYAFCRIYCLKKSFYKLSKALFKSHLLSSKQNKVLQLMEFQNIRVYYGMQSIRI